MKHSPVVGARMTFYKVMETVGAYTAGDLLDIVDIEYLAMLQRSVHLELADPAAVNIENALYGTAGISTYPSAAAVANGVSMAEVLRYISETQLSTLTAADAGGLAATADSIAYSIGEIERHFHGWERWFCKATTANGEVHVADRIGANAGATVPFTVTFGNNTWGSWVQILGSSDTPVGGTSVKYDLHHVQILVANTVVPYFLQVGFGATGAAAVTNDTLSSIVVNPATNQDKTVGLPFMSRRQAVGTKAWARCWCVGNDAKTLTIMFGLHEYEG